MFDVIHFLFHSTLSHLISSYLIEVPIHQQIALLWRKLRMCCIRLPLQIIQEETNNTEVDKKERGKGKSRRNSLVDFIPPIFRKERNNEYHQQVVTMNEIVEECKSNV